MRGEKYYERGIGAQILMLNQKKKKIRIYKGQDFPFCFFGVFVGCVGFIFKHISIVETPNWPYLSFTP